MSGFEGSIQPAKGNFDPKIPKILPHEQVFSIQVGDTLFRISGASLSSDAPSYFTNFFMPYRELPEEQRPVLYLDRSSYVFSYIVKHLQGYYVIPENISTFMHLWSDASYYHLPRLMEQIETSELFCQIGGREFRIPNDIFNHPGDSPNFFTLGFKTFFTGEQDIRAARGLIRPPPVAPPTIANRSAELFAELIDIMRGAKIDNMSEVHRASLLRECRYYRFRGLEQKLIEHDIITTVGECGEYEEIILNMRDVRAAEVKKCDQFDPYFYYKRPWIDEPYRRFVFQFKNDLIKVALKCTDDKVGSVDADGPNGTSVANVRENGGAIAAITGGDPNVPYDTTFENEKTKAHALLICCTAGRIIEGMGSASPALPGYSGYPTITDNADLVLDGKPYEKRRLEQNIYLIDSQWRFVIDHNQLVLELVKGRGYTDIRNQNRMRNFV